MDKIKYYVAILANLLQIVAVFFIYSHSYGQKAGLVLLMAVPAIISIVVIRSGPDYEERKLSRTLRKARIRKELSEIEK